MITKHDSSTIFAAIGVSLQTSRLPFLGLLAAAGFLTAVGCGGGSASVKGSASASASTEGEAETSFDVEGDAAWDQVAEDAKLDEDEDDVTVKRKESERASDKKSSTKDAALLGARHDIAVEANQPAKCRCMSVVVGGPKTPGIVWTGREPVVDESFQLVVALGSEHLSCDLGGIAASYAGYEQRNDDIWIRIEEHDRETPVAHGAIIPKPASGGKVYTFPVGKSHFGKAKNGDKSCLIYE